MNENPVVRELALVSRGRDGQLTKACPEKKRREPSRERRHASEFQVGYPEHDFSRVSVIVREELDDLYPKITTSIHIFIVRSTLVRSAEAVLI